MKKHQSTYDLAKQCSKETVCEVLAIIAENSLTVKYHSCDLLRSHERYSIGQELEEVERALDPFRGRTNLTRSEAAKATKLLEKEAALSRRFDKISASVR